MGKLIDVFIFIIIFFATVKSCKRTSEKRKKQKIIIERLDKIEKQNNITIKDTIK